MKISPRRPFLGVGWCIYRERNDLFLTTQRETIQYLYLYCYELVIQAQAQAFLYQTIFIDKYMVCGTKLSTTRNKRFTLQKVRFTL